MKRILCNKSVARRLGFQSVLILCFLSARAFAQGPMTYLSNLSQTPAAYENVGSNSWLALGIVTGNNPAGYLLDSVQLKMADATGAPSGFRVRLYADANNGSGPFPGSSLVTLTGSTDPSSSGLYTFSPSLTLTLSPGENYFVVVTSDSAVADGAYNWSRTASSTYQSSDNWRLISNGNPLFSSGNGFWGSVPDGPNTYLQFALTATPIPEPGTLGLLLVGAAFAGTRCLRRFRGN